MCHYPVPLLERRRVNGKDNWWTLQIHIVRWAHLHWDLSVFAGVLIDSRVGQNPRGLTPVKPFHQRWFLGLQATLTWSSVVFARHLSWGRQTWAAQRPITSRLDHSHEISLRRAELLWKRAAPDYQAIHDAGSSRELITEECCRNVVRWVPSTIWSENARFWCLAKLPATDRAQRLPTSCRVADQKLPYSWSRDNVRLFNGLLCRRLRADRKDQWQIIW